MDAIKDIVGTSVCYFQLPCHFRSKAIDFKNVCVCLELWVRYGFSWFEETLEYGRRKAVANWWLEITVKEAMLTEGPWLFNLKLILEEWPPLQISDPMLTVSCWEAGSRCGPIENALVCRRRIVALSNINERIIDIVKNSTTSNPSWRRLMAENAYVWIYSWCGWINVIPTYMCSLKWSKFWLALPRIETGSGQ